MTFFLYKPHVYGPEGITTPDIIIDRLGTTPPGMMTSESYLAVDAAFDVTPGFAQIAAGAGALVCPALALSDGRIVLFRSAWRINHLKGSALDVTHQGQTEALVIPDSARGRGQASLHLAQTLMTHAMAPMRFAFSLVNETGRLDAALTLSALAPEASPKGRYSVGPTRQAVKHYI